MGRAKLPCTDLPMKQDVQLLIRPASAFRESEIRPERRKRSGAEPEICRLPFEIRLRWIDEIWHDDIRNDLCNVVDVPR